MDCDIVFDYVLPYTTDNCHWEHAGSYFDRKYASLRDSMYMCKGVHNQRKYPSPYSYTKDIALYFENTDLYDV